MAVNFLTLGEDEVSNVTFKDNPKKDYLFTWTLCSFADGERFKSVVSDEDGNYKNSIINAFSGSKTNNIHLYISQLAQKVNLPTVELDGDTDTFGELDIYTPNREKFNNIQVSYLDDENETVYKYHSDWLKIIRRHYHPVYIYGAKAFYHTYRFDVSEKNSTRSDYVNPTVKQMLSSEFKCIIPQSIQRTSADKSGNNLAGVTVEYRQLIVPAYGPMLKSINNGLSSN